MRGAASSCAAFRTSRPFGHLARGMISVAGMFFNFAALARLPIVDVTTITFASPLITVALSAWILKERVRIYRWSAVGDRIRRRGGDAVAASRRRALHRRVDSAATLGALFAMISAFTNAGSVVQTRRLTDTETTSSIVLYFSLFCALGGLLTLPFGWIVPTPAAVRRAGRPRRLRRALAHPAHRELPLRAGLAGRAARLHGAAVGVHHRLLVLRRGADRDGLCRLGDRRGLGPVRDLARAPARPRAGARPCRRRPAHGDVIIRRRQSRRASALPAARRSGGDAVRRRARRSAAAPSGAD